MLALCLSAQLLAAPQDTPPARRPAPLPEGNACVCGLVGRQRARSVKKRETKRYEVFFFRSVARESLPSGDPIMRDFAPLPGKRALDSDNVLRAICRPDLGRRAGSSGGARRVPEHHRYQVRAGLGASIKSLDVHLEFQRMEDGVWLPLRVSAAAAGRILIFKGFRTRQTTTYSNRKRFGVETEERFESDAPVPR